MTTFRVYPLIHSSVLYLYSERATIRLDPPYQRFGEVWTPDKRELLIDSLLNGFDIPKLYFHEGVALPKGNAQYRFSIVDGRQRLETIWGFIDGDFSLASDFNYLADNSVQAQGLTYKELGERYPRLKALFDATSLPVIVVQTDDLDLIEELFSRLNEAVPLNAAEKRNALGGPAPAVIRKIAQHTLFRERVTIANQRMQHLDLAAKFLYLAHVGGVTDTKKVYLDEFVKGLKRSPSQGLAKTEQTVRRALDEMDTVFVKRDRLLRSSGIAVLYFLLVLQGHSLERKALEAFDEARAENRKRAEKDIAKANYELLEFDRLNQTPNDGYAIEFRLKVLTQHLGHAKGQPGSNRPRKSKKESGV